MGYNLITQCMYTTCSHLRVVTYTSTNERYYGYLFFWVCCISKAEFYPCSEIVIY